MPKSGRIRWLPGLVRSGTQRRHKGALQYVLFLQGHEKQIVVEFLFGLSVHTGVPISTMISDEGNFREGPNPLNRIYISWVQGYKSAGERKSSRIPVFLTLWWA